MSSTEKIHDRVRQCDGPRISVVTVALNAAATLERTLLSVQAQTYPNVEHVVIDGASTDGTQTILQHHDSRIPHWVSEPDRGIADAMNKGALAATGDYLMFINADDYLLDAGSIERASRRICCQPGYDFYAFCISFGTAARSHRCCSRPLNRRMRFKTGIFHQGVICASKAHRELNGFNVDYSYALDYDYFLRAYIAGMRLLPAPEIVAFMSEGGLSTGSDWPSVSRRLRQEHRIQLSNAGDSFWRLVYHAYWAIYLPFKYMKHSGARWIGKPY